MQSTLLSTILSRMNRWPSAMVVEDAYKIRDLDTALRELKRYLTPPWVLRRGSLRVFHDVKEYPIASDHDELAYLDKQNIEEYSQAARFWNTSIQQFYEQVNNQRNLMSEVWLDGTKILGVDYKSKQIGSKILSQADDNDEYTVSDDATASVEDTVNLKKGSSSIKVTIVSSTGTATIKNTFTSFSDSKYKNKYHFRWIYLDAAPTSIEMRLQTDDSNYLSSGALTTQFNGQALQADQWNLIAYGLNNATEVGTFDSGDIASEITVLTGADSGIYYFDESSIKEWELFDYWYYSTNYVKTAAASVADKKFFYTDEDEYDTSDYLVGDDEYVDVIMLDAMLITINAEENKVVYEEISARREKAWSALAEKYPSMVPLITTQRYRFNNNPGISGLGYDQD